MQVGTLKTVEFQIVLAHLIQKTQTAMGQELAAALLPADYTAKVRELLAETREAVLLLERQASPPIGGLPDVRAILRRTTVESVLSGEEIVQVLMALRLVHALDSFLRNHNEEAPLLGARLEGFVSFSRLEMELERAFDEEGTLLDTASVELASSRRDIRSCQHRIKEKLDGMVRSTETQKYLQDPIVTIRRDRYVLPVKQEYRSQVPGLIHDQSGSGATIFVEPLAVVELNNDLKQAESKEKAETERLLRLFSGKIAQIAHDLSFVLQKAAEIDLVFAKARLAWSYKAIEPTVSERGLLKICEGRHPGIDPKAVIPVSIEIGEGYRTLVVSGPNTGGKTVALKMTGLFAVMMQCGLFLPARSDTELPVFKNIYADIGDEQSIEQSLSTFSAHMTHLVAILSSVQQDDLVLVDEICAGTDPNEGAALAMGILDFLRAKNAFTIITTHYSEIKNFAYHEAGMENASVEFDVQSLRPTYRLLIGVPGGSNALHIARRIGLPEAVLTRSNTFLTEGQRQLSELMMGLEGERQKALEANRALQEERSLLEAQRRELEKENEKRRQQTELWRKKAREEAWNVVRNAKQEVAQLQEMMREIQQQENANERAKKLQTLRSRAQGLGEFVPEEADETGLQLMPENMISTGTIVYLQKLRQNGEVLSRSGDAVVVQIGPIKTTVSIRDCYRSTKSAPVQHQEPRKAAKRAARAMGWQKQQETSLELDIRGLNVEEAEEKIAKFLDDAVLGGLEHVRIIHGKGTGALRKGVITYLNKHPQVKKVDMAGWQEGGSGATNVALK